jgi:hypothetical protein
MYDLLDTIGFIRGATAVSTAKRAVLRERYDALHIFSVISLKGGKGVMPSVLTDICAPGRRDVLMLNRLVADGAYSGSLRSALAATRTHLAISLVSSASRSPSESFNRLTSG